MSIREIFGPWLLTSFLLVKRHGEGVLTTFDDFCDLGS